MQLHYQLTESDLREAYAHHQRSAIRRHLIKQARAPYAGIIFPIVGGIIYILLQRLITESPERAASPLTPSIDLFLPPLAVCIPLFLIQAFPAGLRAPNWRALAAALIFLTSFIFFASLLYFSAKLSPSFTPSTLSLGQILAPHLMWLFITFVAVSLFARGRRLLTRLLWLGQKNLHLPFTLDATVDALTLSTPNVHITYPWRAIPSFLETPNLFLLFPSDLTYHILPKRAFATPDDQSAFLNMLRNLTAPSIAFPVLPAAAS